jgi:arginyl-tRNA synthetase
MYQLYTLARVSNILRKYETSAQLTELSWEWLNDDEKLIVKTMLTLPLVVENVLKDNRPHLLTTHIFELSTLVNSWYAKHSVATEKDLDRKDSMLGMCRHIKAHLEFTLKLLGIKPIDSI